MKKYDGHCHCGKVVFEVETELDSSFKCNCSFCVRRAATVHRVDASGFTLKTDEDELGVYGSRDFSKHYFCKSCGINCFTYFQRDSQKAVMVNIGCLDGIDSMSFQPDIFDGANKL